MTQKKSGKAQASLASIAKRLEKLDRDLVRLVQERVKLLVQSAHAESGRPPAIPPELDSGAIERIVVSSRGPANPNCLRAVLREINSGARALVKATKVAYLGPQYSYSHLATIQRFGQSVEFAPVATIAAVFEEVNRAFADYGVVPLENSTDGRIADTLDMLARRPIRICGEIQLRIHHCLLGKCPRAEIVEVYSKPQALSQCREWLAKHLPTARPIEMTSTAAAAQVAAQKPGAAAVASLRAAENYGLDVIASNIEDNPNNVTRFAVIGGDSVARTGRDKTALMFEIPHRPGALADAMSIFKRNRLNLTWIESFPMHGAKNEYLFFVEFEGHQTDARVKRTLAALGRRTVRLEILGSYTRSEPID